MQNRDVFALDRMGLNTFLFAVIVTEADGSNLTILSALARLGEDPWAKAASWAGMSKAAAGEALSACIAQMSLGPKDLEAAPSTAARLVLLLSAPAADAGPGRQIAGLSAGFATMILAAAFAALLLSASLLAAQSGMFAQTSPSASAATRTP